MPPRRHQLYCFRDSRPHRLSLIGDSAYANERATKLAGAQLAQRKVDMLQVCRRGVAPFSHVSPVGGVDLSGPPV